MAKRVLVLGMAKSGVAAAKLLVHNKYEVVINDQKPRSEFGDKLDSLEGLVDFELGRDARELLAGVELMVISPGVPIEHPAVAAAREAGIEVIGELELAYRLSMGRVVAITGTNGKTTTTTLLGEIFKNAGKTTYVVGNIGDPYAEIADKTRADDVIVVEVSTFQLESIEKFHPSVSAILNVTEDHLNRHKTMERYTALKARVFENQKDGDSVVLNYDDPITREMAAKAMCRVVWFSRKTVPPFGAFVRDGDVFFGSPENARMIIKASEILIPGPHNLENALAATAVAMQSGVQPAVIRLALKTFQGVEHRIETVLTHNGVTFINDSKATNPDSTIKAVETMKAPTVLMLGGSEKYSDYSEMCNVIVSSGMITDIVTIGETAPAIERALRESGYSRIHPAGRDFKAAIELAYSLAPKGGNVLLSPACASFDMFSCYEERGEKFKIVARGVSG